MPSADGDVLLLPPALLTKKMKCTDLVLARLGQDPNRTVYPSGVLGREGGLWASLSGLKADQIICSSGQTAALQACLDTHPATFRRCVCFLPCGNSGVVDLATSPGFLHIQPFQILEISFWQASRDQLCRARVLISIQGTAGRSEASRPARLCSRLRLRSFGTWAVLLDEFLPVAAMLP